MSKILSDEDLEYLKECILIYHPSPASPYDKVYEFCQKYGWTAVYEKKKYQKGYDQFVKDQLSK